MPFTPYHMGPGMLTKSLFQERFSILLFGWSQVLIDLQALIFHTTGIGVSHGLPHTFVGSFFIAIFAAISGKYMFEAIFRVIGNKTNLKNFNLTYSFRKNQYTICLFKDLNISYSWGVVFLSVFIGSFSHIIIDALCHQYMTPLYPFDDSNPFFKLISYRTLLISCILSGLVGIFIYSIVKMTKYKKL